MDARAYLLSLLIASVLGGVCASLAGKPFEKYLRYLSALVCILLVLSPFKRLDLQSLLQDIPSASQNAPAAKTLAELSQTLAEQRICAYISDCLLAETGITARTVRIDMEQTDTDPVIRSLTLVLTPGQDTAAAAAWAEKTYRIPVTVCTEEGGEVTSDS